MSKQGELKLDLYSQLEVVTSALGSSVRLRIIQLLAQSPKTVDELAGLVGESVANTSQHLKKLSSANLIQFRKEGLYRRYEITDERVLRLWEDIQDLTKTVSARFETVREQLVDPSLVAKLSAREVLSLVIKRKAYLIDARDVEEASATVVTGALNIPAKDLIKKSGEFSKSKPVFLFCRGPMCTLANSSVTKLREQGFECYRLLESPYQMRELAKRKRG